MMIGLIFIAVVVAFAFTGLIMWARYELLKEARTPSEQIQHIFEGCWNGKDVSRQAAWFRTIKHLETYGYPKEMATEARIRLLMAEEPTRSDYVVKTNGKIVKVTEKTSRQ